MFTQKISILFLFFMAGLVRVSGQEATVEQKGKVLFQIFASSDADNSTDGIGFNISRAHLGYQYRFNDEFSAKLILDRGPSTEITAISVTDSLGRPLDVTWGGRQGSEMAMALKFASLEWKVSSAMRLQMGGILQNHYITQERFWGYRYVAKTFQDRYFHTPSGDLGAIVYYGITSSLSMDVALTNGEGFRVQQDGENNVKWAGGIGLTPKTGLNVRLYTDYWQARGVTQRLESLFMGYRWANNARIGGEWNSQVNHGHIDGLILEGFSLFGSLPLNDKSALFLRVDQLDSVLPGEGQEAYAVEDGFYFIGGASVTPVKGVCFSLNYQGWKPDTNPMDWTHQFLISCQVHN